MIRHFTLLASLFWLAATGALAATLPATPATYAATITAAKAGDVLQLAPGRYGPVVVSKSGLDVVADPAALFDKVTITGATGVTWRGGRIEIPAAGAVSSTAAVRIVNSKDVTFGGAVILGAIAETGVLQTALPTDPRPGDNVIGLPTGRGFSVEFSDHVTIEGNEVSRVHKGIVLSRSPDTTIAHNHIHDFRTSGIAGDAPNNTVVAFNWIHDAHPFLYGDPSGKGDHGDLSHMWTPAGMGLTSPTTGLVYRGNILEQGYGVALCCAIFFEDNSGFGYTGALIEGNTILNGAAQGIAVSHTVGTITGNVMLQTSGTAKNGPTLLERPAFLAQPGSGSQLTVTGNTMTDLYGARPATSRTAAMEKPSVQYPANTWLAPGIQPDIRIAEARTAALIAAGFTPPPPVDHKDAQIADLTAKLAAANDNLAAANDNTARAIAERDGARAVAASLQVEADRLRGVLGQISALSAQ